jgi:hypothetical protein
MSNHGFPYIYMRWLKFDLSLYTHHNMLYYCDRQHIISVWTYSSIPYHCAQIIIWLITTCRTKNCICIFCLFMITCILQTMVFQYILQTTILLKALYHIWYYTPTNFIRKHSICSIVDILEKYHDIYAIP